MKKLNSKKGITLIALVITIIILLILAGIVISLALGENGIIKRAQESEKTYQEQAAREKLELVLLDLQADKATNTSYNEDEYLNTKIKQNGMKVNGDIVLVDGWKFQIDRSVPNIVTGLGEGESQANKQVTIDTELEKLLKEANMTITVEDILNTPAIMREVRGLIPKITQGDVIREETDEIVTYKDHTGGIIRTNSENDDGKAFAWEAFDDDANTSTYSKMGSAEGYYLEYEFMQPVYAMQMKYIFDNSSTTEGTRTIIIQAYDEDDNSWKDLTQELTWTGDTNAKKEDVANLPYSKPYKRYRLYVTSATYTTNKVGADHSGLWLMQLYGVYEKTETEEELKQLLLSNSNIEEITLSQMTTNKEFIRKLINQLSIETVKNNPTLMANLPDLIPESTKDNVTREVIDGVITYRDHTGGIIRTNSECDDGKAFAWEAFDNDANTSTYSEAGSAEGYYLEYEFMQPVYAMQIKYVFDNSATAEGIRKIVIQAYDEDDNSWEDLTQELTWTGNMNTKKEDIERLNDSKPYKRYRLYVTSATYTSYKVGADHSGLVTMQLYGKVAK